jgi:stringent starvation protein B
MTDSAQTPHLVVDATGDDVEVPREHVKEGRIVLNVSYSATHRLELGNEEVTFEARFGGSPRRVRIPMPAVLGIYARETGEGLVFPVDEYTAAGSPGEPPPDPAAPGPDGAAGGKPKGRRPALKVVR